MDGNHSDFPELGAVSTRAASASSLWSSSPNAKRPRVPPLSQELRWRRKPLLDFPKL
jgi:hypothetical protein